MPFAKWPTAPLGVGNRYVEGGVAVPLAVPLPLGFTTIIMGEMDYLKNPNVLMCMIPKVASTSFSRFLLTAHQNIQPRGETKIKPSDQRRLMDLSQEIASLEARVDTETNSEAKSPRVRRLTSVSARQAVDAYYLQSWRRKVETVGNLNYPEEARRDQLYGSLRLMVSIMPDGGLKEVRILDSSGFKVLDDAAIRIVRQAAPFAPFPEEMRQSTDVLEIIRTWQFRKNHYSSS